MKRRSLHALFRPVLLFCALVCLLAPSARSQKELHAQESATANTREDRLKIFDQVWRAISENYYDKRYRGLDWRLQRDIFRPQAEAARNSSELYYVLRQMIGKLGDAHTRIYTPEDGFDRDRPAGSTVGVSIRRIEGKAVVSWVAQDSEAFRQGVRPGYTVSDVDRVPVEDVIKRLREEIVESSTPTALEAQAYDRIFYGPRDTPVLVTFLDGEEKPKEVTLTRHFVEFHRRVISRKLDHNIGYIEITGFGPEIEKDFETAIREQQGTRGLILDLRNNGGGFVTTVAQIASYFLPEGYDLGQFISRQGRAVSRFTQRMDVNYREPLTVLVSGHSASGSEIFVSAMQEEKRATIFGSGSSTCGCLLGVSRTLKLLDGGKLNISDSDFRTASGRRIEGTGINPDFQVESRIADLLAGRDRMLEMAEEQLGRIIAFGTRGEKLSFRLNLPTAIIQSTIHASDASQERP